MTNLSIVNDAKRYFEGGSYRRFQTAVSDRRFRPPFSDRIDLGSIQMLLGIESWFIR